MYQSKSGLTTYVATVAIIIKDFWKTLGHIFFHQKKQLYYYLVSSSVSTG